MPRIVCGSSVGSLVAAVICCRPYSEFPTILDPENVFNHPMLKKLANSSFEVIWNMLNRKKLLCHETLKAYIRRHTGDLTFKEIYNQFGWNLNITVTDFSMNLESRLLNYLTTPNVLVWSAVVASCSIPGVFGKIDLF